MRWKKLAWKLVKVENYHFLDLIFHSWLQTETDLLLAICFDTNLYVFSLRRMV
jgi:hypothetical protein